MGRHTYFQRGLRNSVVVFCFGTKVPRHSAYFGTDGRLVCTSLNCACLVLELIWVLWLHVNEWPLRFNSCQILNLHYQSSSNPSRNLRDWGRRQQETPKCCGWRVQARHESDYQRRRQETSDQWQQRVLARRESVHEARRLETSDQRQQKTTGQARFRPSSNTTRKISGLPHGLISPLACSLCWQRKTSDQQQQMQCTTGQARIIPQGKATRNKWSATAKTTSLVRIVSAY